MTSPANSDPASVNDATSTRSFTELPSARIPTQHGEFTAYAFANDGSARGQAREHLVCVWGDLADGASGDGDIASGTSGGAAGDIADGEAGGEPVLVRVHSECITGDVLGSQRCDCGKQLDMAMEIIGTAGRGVLLYLRDHEGRGIGLRHKLQAYRLQDDGRDTVDANLHQGFPADARQYGVAAEILGQLGVSRIRLLTNNPSKIDQLSELGIEVLERVPLETVPSHENIDYLRAKRDRLGHLLSSL